VIQTPKLQVIRKASYKATPWKNGGGITHEAMRMPPSGDPFRWRVSIAHIDASGPFSDFAEYNRKMVLLQGAGIELRFADGAHKALRKVGDLAEFDGALSAHCELLQGPCVDLNLIISKSDGVAVRVERFIESLTLSAARDETLLIFPIERRVTLEVNRGKTLALEPWDLAVLSHGSGRLRRLESGHSSASTSVFLATLKFMSGE
jgi:environmental stress-induced protein Ves